jgi:LuxR family transcriptional regulator
MKRLLPYLAMDNVDDLWAHHTQVMAEFGFDRLFYAFNAFRGAGLYDNPEDALLLTNMPSDYVEAYVGGGMFRDGVMLRWAVQNTGAASWRDVYEVMLQEPVSKGQQAMLELNHRHGLVAGYTISFPMAIKNANAGIGLVAKHGMTQDDVDAIWAQHGEIIQIINHVAHLCILQLPAAGQRRLLTARQAEVLELVADGKTMQDIAIVLERNVATVEKHLRGARDALGVETTAQAVRKASVLRPWRPRRRSLLLLLDAFAPSSRTKPVISAPASLAAASTVRSGFTTKAWPSSVTSARNFFIRPTIIFSMTCSGLPLSRAMSIWTCFSFSTTAGSRSASDSEAGFTAAMCIATCLPKRLVAALQRDQHADLAHAVGGGVVDIGHTVSPRAWPCGAATCSRRWWRSCR